jgi:protein O-mannosyl-transferase
MNKPPTISSKHKIRFEEFRSFKKNESMKFETRFCVLAILLAGILFYSQSWNNPFVFDDIIKIQENGDLKLGSGILERLLYPYTQNATNLLRNDPSRPMTFLIYKLCYGLSGGQAWSFHLASTLFHSLNAVWVFLLTALLAQRLFKSQNLTGPLLAALFFLFLPINSGTVLYAFAFSDVIATFFLLGALWIFLRDTEMSLGSLLGALGLFICALLSKQSAIVLPALILLSDSLLHQVQRRRLYAYLGFTVIALAYVCLRYAFFGSIGDLEGTGSTHAPLEYLQTQGPMILKYLWMSLVPSGLALDHAPMATSFSILEITLSWGLLLVTGLASVFVLFRKTSSSLIKLLAWFWLFFLAGLAPTSSFVPTVDLFVERRAYLGSFALAAVFGFIVIKLRRGNAGLIGGGVITLLFAAVCWGRSQVYKSPETLWSESVRLYPQSKRARVNLGVIYDQQGRHEEAKKIFEAVLAQYPNDAFVHTKVALIYQNLHYEGHNLRHAAEEYQKALQLNPNDIVTLYNAGLLMVDAGNLDQAEALFRHSLEIHPRFPYALMGLGITFVKKGQITEARRLLIQALEIDPGLEGAKVQLQRLPQ